jgi:multidrug efflux pump subunit AcrA (membrane-fusion protein)
MNKVLHLLFVLVLVAAVACGDSGQPEEEPTAAPASSPSLLSDAPESASVAEAPPPSTDEVVSVTATSEPEPDEVVAEAPAGS